MRIFGEIKGINPGDIFENRIALREAGVHLPNQKGISGSSFIGADSIDLSGGYEDDEDHGDVIIYTGAGGQKYNKQVADQVLEGDNLALAKSKIEKLPVRVTRGHQHKNTLSPANGYQYAGLYYVDDYWKEVGKSGYIIWRFRLTSNSHVPSGYFIDDPSAEYNKTTRKKSSVNRIVRNYKIAKNVKYWHDCKCQICGLAIETSAGLYAEAGHIKPLGEPHNGPDIESNILCLCPNHHVMFDNGGFTIADNLELIGIKGKLRVLEKHRIDANFIKYHREHYQKNA
jgi:putative restriction endonuclease